MTSANKPKPATEQATLKRDTIATTAFPKRKAKKAKRKPGRPSSFTQATADRICALLSEGQSLRRICESSSMPSKQTVLTWLSKPERAEFLAQYVRAREAQADYYAEEIIEISDDTSHDTKTDENGNERQDTEWISRSKLRVDTRKWLMARMAPKKYGDKITTELTGSIGISHEDALSRLDDDDAA